MIQCCIFPTKITRDFGRCYRHLVAIFMSSCSVKHITTGQIIQLWDTVIYRCWKEREKKKKHLPPPKPWIWMICRLTCLDSQTNITWKSTHLQVILQMLSQNRPKDHLCHLFNVRFWKDLVSCLTTTLAQIYLWHTFWPANQKHECFYTNCSWCKWLDGKVLCPDTLPALKVQQTKCHEIVEYCLHEKTSGQIHIVDVVTSLYLLAFFG